METTHQTSTKDDILNHLLKESGATAQEIAESLCVSPQAVRRHLKDLEAEGRICHKAVRANMGRPQHAYELTAKGREAFPHRYDEFAVSLLDTLAETVGRDRVGSVLRKQWERKATEYRQKIGGGSLTERITRLVSLRRTEGYMTEWERLDELEGQPQFAILEYNCVISNVAESFPSICGHELEMFAAILPDCIVERTHWLNGGEHRCGYSIRSRS